MRIGGATFDIAGMMHRIGRARNGLARTSERLASGRRIVRAGDDPAGTAKAARLGVRARSLAQTQRNLRDGRSLLEAADEGLSQIQDNIYRVRELAVLAASDTMGRAERLTLNGEAQRCLQAIEDTAHETKVFGQQPLVKEDKTWEPPIVAVGIVADSSGSMTDEMNRLPAALDDFVTRLQGASADTRVGVAAYGTSEDNLDAVDRLVDIDAPGLDAALAGLAARPGGSMDAYSALLNVSGAEDWAGQAGRDPDVFDWPDTQYKHLIVVTDTAAQEWITVLGNATGVYNDQSDVASALAAQGVRVHVVGPDSGNWLGTADELQATFQEIVDETRGSYQRMASDGSDIGDALDAIADEVLDVIDFPPPPEVVEVQAGPDIGQTIDLQVPVDARLKALRLDDVQLVTKIGANDALKVRDDDPETVTGGLDDALDKVVWHRALVGAKMNRLDHAVFIQGAMEASCDATRGRIEDLDLVEGTAEHMQQQLKLRAASAVFKRAQLAQRATAQAMTATLGGARLLNAAA